MIAWPATARAQQAAKVLRLGFLGFGNAAVSANRVEAFRAGWRGLGYVEGKNLVIEFRWAETVEQLQEASAELVSSAAKDIAQLTLALISINSKFACALQSSNYMGPC